jgi:hypothetical protein
MIEIWSGDPFSTKGKGVSGWASRELTIPHTSEFHFGIIGPAIFDRDSNFVDFETRESIDKGPSVGRFFRDYGNSIVKLYRVTDATLEDGKFAIMSTSEIGRSHYDYMLLAVLGWDVVSLLFTMQFPPYRAEQLSYSSNHDYICTEEVDYAWVGGGHRLVPRNVVTIPSSLKQAELDNVMSSYYESRVSNLIFDHEENGSYIFEISDSL